MKKKVIVFVAGCVLGCVLSEIVSGRRLRKIIHRLEDGQLKFKEFYFLIIQWLRVHSEGRTLVNYFKNNGFQTVAIYGMRELGEALLDELENTDISVKYGIDQNAENLYVGCDMFTPDEELEPVDVVVVTAVHYYDDIEQCLQEKMNCKIVSLEDVVWEA